VAKQPQRRKGLAKNVAQRRQLLIVFEPEVKLNNCLSSLRRSLFGCRELSFNENSILMLNVFYHMFV